LRGSTVEQGHAHDRLDFRGRILGTASVIDGDTIEIRGGAYGSPN
jgi:hypothetical protein